MEFNKLVFAGLAVGCLAAAAGGSYLAVRQNQDAGALSATGATSATGAPGIAPTAQVAPGSPVAPGAPVTESEGVIAPEAKPERQAEPAAPARPASRIVSAPDRRASARPLPAPPPPASQSRPSRARQPCLPLARARSTPCVRSGVRAPRPTAPSGQRTPASAEAEERADPARDIQALKAARSDAFPTSSQTTARALRARSRRPGIPERVTVVTATPARA